MGKINPEKTARGTLEACADCDVCRLPSFCEVFTRNPGKMMAEMMPLCMDMMKSCNMDMPGRMGGTMDANKGREDYSGNLTNGRAGGRKTFLPDRSETGE